MRTGNFKLKISTVEESINIENHFRDFSLRKMDSLYLRVMGSLLIEMVIIYLRDLSLMRSQWIKLSQFLAHIL